MDDKQLNSLSLLSTMSESAINLMDNREAINPKFPRTFTRIEATEYLRCDYRTLLRHAEALEIDPAKYQDDGIDFLLDIDEIYQIRDALPDTTILKKQFQRFVRSDKQKTQRVAIQNQKGGVGKTLTAITVGTGIAIEYQQQYRICIVDMDGQSTMTMYQPPRNGETRVTIGELLQVDPNSDGYEEFVRASVSETTVPNMKLLPAAQGDREIEAIFHQGVFAGEIADPYQRLNAVLNALEDDFDIIIIDTPPSFGYAALNAYYAASSIIFPLGANQNDVDATCQYLSYLPNVYKTLLSLGHPGYDFVKMLVTNYEESTSSIDVMSDLTNYFSSVVFPTQFKKSEAVRQCSLNKNCLFDLSPSTYPGKTKKTFNVAKVNALAVVSQIMNEVNKVWKQQESA